MRWRDLRSVVHSRHIHAAVAESLVLRVGGGRYALPTAETARRTAAGLTAVASHTSAASHWGWPLEIVPDRPHVTVHRARRLTTSQRSQAISHRRDLMADEVVDGWVTSPVRTVIDCCLDLPWDEALTVFDSSWRAGLTPREVQLATRRLPVQQRRRVLMVARAADPRAANPFESVLRSIATTVPGWAPVPQLGITTRGRAGRAHFAVDLADEDLHIVLEADSFEFHGKRKALDRDCRRYDRLVVDGWLVLRFSWEMVMTEPHLVRQLIADAVELRRRMPRQLVFPAPT